jgi:hypothetical protein
MTQVAGRSYGSGLGSFVNGIVGSNPAQGMVNRAGISVLYYTLQVEALRWADSSFRVLPNVALIIS